MKVLKVIVEVLLAVALVVAAILGIRLVKRIIFGEVGPAGDPWKPMPDGKIESGGEVFDPGISVDQIKAVKVEQTKITVERLFEPKERG